MFDNVFLQDEQLKHTFIQNILDRIEAITTPNERITIRDEINEIFEYVIHYCRVQYNDDLLFFISVLSDALWVTEDSLHDICKAIQVDVPVPPVQNTSHPLVEDRNGNKTKLDYMTLQHYLPNYVFSKEFSHALFDNHLCVSCYPKEMYEKVEICKRFSATYLLPENKAKYARPILDIEFPDNSKTPYVRCYLTLTDRPRPDSHDKDIIQDNNGKIIFSNVQLMNFGDPLRALTWVEDYIKNPEHHLKNDPEPIIRSFLIPLSQYRLLIESGVLVDADRAPGQMKHVKEDCLEKFARRDSLVSFTNHQNTHKTDGKIMRLEALSDYLLGQPIHPKDLAKPPHIAHQYGRSTETTTEKKCTRQYKPHPLIVARHLERVLSGFAKPSSNKKDSELSFFKKKKNQTAHHSTDPILKEFGYIGEINRGKF